MKNLGEIVSESFIWGVGITRPAQGQERRATRFIVGTLVGSIAAVVAAFLLIVSHLHPR